METSNVTLYAMWAEKTYTVTYNGNENTDGSVPNDPNNYKKGATVTVIGNTGNLVKTGNTFGGWTYGGNTYNDKDIIIMGTSNVTLTAKWIPNHKVIYNANGGAGTVPAQPTDYAEGAIVMVLGNTGNPHLTKDGYDFGGWTYGGKTYKYGDPITMGTYDIILTANWILLYSYIVTFDDQEATTPVSPTTKTVTSPATAVDQLPTPPQKENCEFKGWYTEQNGQGSQFTESTSVTKDITVFAWWSCITGGFGGTP
jgi:uncharacterized repeat protein (TIGR02543 family)